MAHVFTFSGVEKPVKNLGWLVRHAGEAQSISVRGNGLNGNEASLIVTGDGWVFYSPFASADALRGWLKRHRSFAGVPVAEDMSQFTTLRELRSAMRCRHTDVARPTDSDPHHRCKVCRAVVFESPLSWTEVSV